MKQFNHKILGAIAVLFLVSACSSPEKKNEIGEPNNSILEAGLLQSGESYTMKIDSVGDVDWYAVPVSGKGYLDVSTKNVPKGLNLVIRFAEKQEWEQKKVKWRTSELGLPATIPIYEADTVYFRIKDKFNKNASDEEIVFKPEFIEEFDQYEPNNVSDSAKMVTTGEVIKSTFYPTSDIDWFRTTVDSSGYLMLQARSVPKNINVHVRFAKKPDAFSKIDYISSGMDLPAAIQVTDPGDYYFYLKDKFNAEMSKDMAEWKIDFIPEMDTTEPNNNFDQAYLLAIDDTVKIAIFPVGDHDYFTLTPDANSTIRIATKHPKNLRPEIQLYVEKDFERKPIGKWQELPTTLEVEAGQKYYIRLHSKLNNSYSQEPVLFSVSRIEGKSDK